MNVDPNLTSHPKYRRLRKSLEEEPAAYLLRLWGHCAQNKRGEAWPNADADYVEIICEWEGDPGVLYQALVRWAWIHEEAGGIRVHDWEEMNSFTVKNWTRNTSGRPPRKKAEGTPKANPTEKPRRSHGLTSAKPAGSHGEALRVNEMNEGGENARAHEESPGGDQDLAQVPTLEEVQGYGAQVSIPADFCAHFHGWHEINRAWWNRSGFLLNWQRKLEQWWSRDRDSWAKNKKRRAAADPDTAERRAQLEAERDAARTPAERRAAEAALAQLEEVA